MRLAPSRLTASGPPRCFLAEMQPYYERDGITIYHGDCREVLPGLGSDRWVLTDPPYNIGYKYLSYGDKLSQGEYWQLLRESLGTRFVVVHYPESVCELSVQLGEAPAKVVAWVYNSPLLRQWRAVAWFGISPDFQLDSQPYKNPTDKRVAALIENGRMCRLYDWWHVQQVKNVSEEKTQHPCQIPIEVNRKIIRITQESGTILDPFMGSGTTLVAAKLEGRKAVGIEIEERYCEIAANRLAQGVFDFSEAI